MKCYVFLLIFISHLICSISSIALQNRRYSDELFVKSTNSVAEVCASAGCVRGKVESGRVKPYEAFYGIPYAEPPTGKLRFESPVPYGGWSGYWDATYPRDYCIQKDYYGPQMEITGSEDCLYLQVYRPIYRKKDQKLPVVVFIHPGSFIVYSSTPPFFGPEYFMDNGEVIVVTFNYRLGLLGFLCSGDEAVKGNFGLKDQQLALQWVATNIEAFGGDPNSVTLLGHNVGAVSANLHMMNPVSQNLFHRVILMGGNAYYGPDNYPHDFATQFRKTAKYAGLPNWDTASTDQLAYKLKYVDASTLVNVLDHLFAFVATPFTPVRPCIEGDWADAFLTEDPRTLWAEGRFAQKPMIVSTVHHPGDIGAVITTNETILAAFNQYIYKFLPIQMDFHPRYITDVLKFYFGEKDFIDDTNVNYYYKMVGDRFSYYPIITLIKQYLQYANVQENPVYMFEFAFESNYTFVKYLTGKDINLGVGYFDDLFYLFTQAYLFPPFDPDSPEGRMSDILVRTMVNFIARGEIKVWRRFTSCTAASTPFCDWQVFNRYDNLDPNQVEVSISNAIDIPMFNFWSKIDNGINALTNESCS